MNEEYDFEELAPWLVLLITIAGGLLRVLYLGAKGMWLDEAFSVWLAGQSLPDMLHWMVKIDQHPPLYYLLLHYWIAFQGDTPYYVRLLSVLFGTATIPVIYLIGKRLSGPVVGVVAAMFLAVSLFNIYYAQETRMYTLLAFNVAVAIYAQVRLLTDPHAVLPIGTQLCHYLHTWRTSGPADPAAAGEFSYQDEVSSQAGWHSRVFGHRRPPIQTVETDLAWAAFIVFSAATILTHNAALFFLLAANFFVLGLLLWQKIRPSASPSALQSPSLANWVKAQIAVLLLWSPWVVVFIQQARRVAEEFWIPQPTWDIVSQSLRNLLNASAPNQSFQDIMAGMLCVVLALGLVYYRKRLSIFLFLATLFVVPVLGELIVSLRRPIFLDRTLIWVTIPLILLLAAGIAQLRYRLLIVLAVGIIATNYLFNAGDYLRFYQKEDWGTAAGYVARFAEEGDLVLFNSNFIIIPFDYYFEPFEEQYRIQVDKQGVPLDLFSSGILEPKMTAADIPALTALVSGRDRVWLVYSHNSYTDPQGLVPQTLANLKSLVRTREFYGGQVQLYGSP